MPQQAIKILHTPGESVLAVTESVSHSLAICRKLTDYKTEKKDVLQGKLLELRDELRKISASYVCPEENFEDVSTIPVYFINLVLAEFNLKLDESTIYEIGAELLDNIGGATDVTEKVKSK